MDTNCKTSTFTITNSDDLNNLSSEAISNRFNTLSKQINTEYTNRISTKQFIVDPTENAKLINKIAALTNTLTTKINNEAKTTSQIVIEPYLRLIFELIDSENIDNNKLEKINRTINDVSTLLTETVQTGSLPELGTQALLESKAPLPALPELETQALPELGTQALLESNAPPLPALPELETQALLESKAPLPTLPALPELETQALPELGTQALLESNAPPLPALPELEAQALLESKAPLPALPELETQALPELGTQALPELGTQALLESKAPEPNKPIKINLDQKEDKLVKKHGKNVFDKFRENVITKKKEREETNKPGNEVKDEVAKLEKKIKKDEKKIKKDEMIIDVKELKPKRITKRKRAKIDPMSTSSKTLKKDTDLPSPNTSSKTGIKSVLQRAKNQNTAARILSTPGAGNIDKVLVPSSTPRRGVRLRGGKNKTKRNGGQKEGKNKTKRNGGQNKTKRNDGQKGGQKKNRETKKIWLKNKLASW